MVTVKLKTKIKNEVGRHGRAGMEANTVQAVPVCGVAVRFQLEEGCSWDLPIG